MHIGFGLTGERVANTPIRLLPPNRGGLTVVLSPNGAESEQYQITHRWLNPSSPRNRSLFAYSGSKTSRPSVCGTRAGWRGIPNLEGKSVRSRYYF